MLTTLAFVAALGLTPGQSGKLELTNIRPTFGVLGATRPNLKYLPGDQMFLAYDIENIKVDSYGKVLYGMSMQVVDSKKKVWFEQKGEQEKIQAYNSLGGTRLPAFANVNIGVNQPAGEYTLRVTVTDRATKTVKELVQKFEVLSPSFGIVRLTTSLDEKDLLPAPMIGVPGQFVYVNFVTVGFGRDAKKQPNMSLAMRVIDEKGKPTLAKPSVGEVADLPEKVQAVPMQFQLSLNRPGRFTVELKATDNVTKKTSTLTFPLTGAEQRQIEVAKCAGPLLRGKACNAATGNGEPAMSQIQERIAQFRKMANDDPDNELGHFRLGQLLHGGRPARRSRAVVSAHAEAQPAVRQGLSTARLVPVCS